MPVVVSTVTAGGVLPDVGRALPVLQAGLAWGLVCGVLVAPLAVVVHRAAGAVPDTAGDAEEPWPAPAATATDQDEPGASTEADGSTTEPADAAERSDGSDGSDRERAASAERDEVRATV